MPANLDIISRLVETARAHGADACDAVMFETTDASLSHRLGKPEAIERAESKALGLRVFVGQSSAIVSSNDALPDTLDELAARAVAMARVTPADADSMLAPESLYASHPPDLELFDHAEPDEAWMTAQCRDAEDAALSVKGITNSEGADAQYSKSSISLAIHNGTHLAFAQSYCTSHFSVSVSVIAGVGTGMERDYDYTSARYRSDLQSARSVGLSASERALKRLSPRKVPTAQVPVIFDPRVSRSLLGIFSGSISGSSIARGSSFLQDNLHQDVFASGITIIDDPHMKRGFGSRPFDGEGVKNGKRTLVDNGTLTTWLLDMRTANRLGMQTTGHAARGVASAPSPSSSNLYMQNGTVTPAELIKNVKNGLYLTETFGMGVNITTGDYSQGAAGFWIENGELAYPVSEITIASNLRDMFKGLTPANDLEFRYATNAPTLRIETMTVAGS